MPAVFLLLPEFVVRFREHQDGPATFGLALFMYLIIVAQLTLNARHIALAAAVGVLLAGLFQVGVGAPSEVTLMW